MLCEICGQDYPQKSIVVHELEEGYAFSCPTCYQHIHSCVTCSYKEECALRKDNSEPQVVNQTTRQGNMIFTAQVLNPKLVEKHCSVCRCSGENNECHQMSESINCSHYVILSHLLYKKK